MNKVVGAELVTSLCNEKLDKNEEIQETPSE